MASSPSFESRCSASKVVPWPWASRSPPMFRSIVWRCGSESATAAPRKTNRREPPRSVLHAHRLVVRSAPREQSRVRLALRQTNPIYLKENLTLLRLAILFLVVALLAGFFGFNAVADYS